MKYSGIKWIGTIPDDWKIIKNKYVVDLYTGNSIKDEEKDLYTDEENSDLYISSKNIDVDTGELILNDILHVSKDDNTFVRAYPNDILMCIEGGSAGRKKTWLSQTVTFVNKLCCFHPTGISSKYLYYILQSPHYESEFNLNMSGLIGGVTKGKLDNFIYPLPPKEKQNTIVNWLDKKIFEINALVEIEKNQMKKLEEYKQSIIFDAVTKGLDKCIRLKDSGVEWIGMIPNNWKIMRIKDAFVLNNERTDETDLKKVNLISLYTDQGVVQHSDLIETTGNRAITAEGYKFVRKKDIVVNIILCWMGAIGISEYNGVTSPAYDVYSPKEGVVSKYYHYLFRTNKFNGECFKYGRGIMLMRWRTYSTEFKSIFIPYPSLAEQEKIVEYLDIKCRDIDELISIKQKKIEKLYEYKKSLVYEYVTGKKEVIA